ncbi:MAG: hypothetical protein NVSMB25_17540 [Thermoleophilaceae bacterium]
MRAATLIIGGTLMVAVLPGCGDTGSFKNKPRPPVTIQVDGVIRDNGVTVAPNHFGGGPIQLIVSNQTQQAHTIMLERTGNQGEPNRDSVGPVNPLGTATLQQTLTPGEYRVSVDSQPGTIPPATIVVSRAGRPSASNTTLLP